MKHCVILKINVSRESEGNSLHFWTFCVDHNQISIPKYIKIQLTLSVNKTKEKLTFTEAQGQLIE